MADGEGLIANILAEETALAQKGEGLSLAGPSTTPVQERSLIGELAVTPLSAKGSVIGGAAAGGLLGGARSSRQNRQNDQRQQQWEQQQMAEYNRNRSNWNRAFAGCMESRDYTVR